MTVNTPRTTETSTHRDCNKTEFESVTALHFTETEARGEGNTQSSTNHTPNTNKLEYDSDKLLPSDF